MSINFSCAKCGASVHAKNEHSGKYAKCPKCGQVLMIPHLAECSVSGKSSNIMRTPKAEENLLSVSCSCGKTFKANSEYVEKQAKCPICGKLLKIPETKNAIGLKSEANSYLENEITKSLSEDAIMDILGSAEPIMNHQIEAKPLKEKISNICPRCRKRLPEGSTVCIVCEYDVCEYELSKQNPLNTISLPKRINLNCIKVIARILVTLVMIGFTWFYWGILSFTSEPILRVYYSFSVPNPRCEICNRSAEGSHIYGQGINDQRKVYFCKEHIKSPPSYITINHPRGESISNCLFGVIFIVVFLILAFLIIVYGALFVDIATKWWLDIPVD